MYTNTQIDVGGKIKDKKMARRLTNAERLQQLQKKLVEEREKLDRLKNKGNILAEKSMNYFDQKYHREDNFKGGILNDLQKSLNAVGTTVSDLGQGLSGRGSGACGVSSTAFGQASCSVTYPPQSYDHGRGYVVDFQNKIHLNENDEKLKKILMNIYGESGFEFVVKEESTEEKGRVIIVKTKDCPFDSELLDLCVNGKITSEKEVPKWEFFKDLFYHGNDEYYDGFIGFIWRVIPKETLISSVEVTEFDMIKAYGNS